MFELLDTNPAIAVQDSEYSRLLGYPAGRALEGRALELASWARAWYAEHGQPWVCVRETPRFDLSNERLRIEGHEFASTTLHQLLRHADAENGMLALVSAGRECEEKAGELWREEKPDEYFFLEIFGSAVAEHLVTMTGARLCAWAETRGLAVLPHYSPGYTGWDVADQVPLFDLLRNACGSAFPRDIQIRESGMLEPKKSLLALFGLTRQVERVRGLRELVPCEHCAFAGCDYRRAPFKHTLAQFEDVRSLQAAIVEPEPSAAPYQSPLAPDAKYSLNSRALQKWSRERLQLTELPDTSVEARFRYDGTTCSNMGVPLAFHYDIKLGPAHTGYRIEKAVCAPAPGDTGHARMCGWIDDAEGLGARIRDEKPLLGQPLNDVLNWQRPSAPSGCYCEDAARMHKWGLAFEVVHYALAQRHKQTNLT
jgi:hypothetical protein